MTPKDIRILIVDHANKSRCKLRTLLEKQGYELEEAVDGLEALEKVRTKRPHLVMMDIIMPKMNGLDCCRLIKGDAVLADTKIIILTARDEEKYVTASYRYGCDDFITKPIDEQDLLKRVSILGLMASHRTI